MGIYDREYYRHEGSGFLRSFTGQGQVWKWLILINVILFVVQLGTRPANLVGVFDLGPVTDTLCLIPQAVLNGEVWRLLTYAFLHDPGSLLHIVFNMLFLWWFGSSVEDLYGPREFLAFYLVSAVLGGLAFTAWGINHGLQTRCLGASGAVTAVLVLFALHYPSHTIYLWGLIPIPIWLFVIFNVAQDAFFFLNPAIRTNTAVTVHLAGAAFGFCYFKMQWRLTNLWPNFRSWKRQRPRPRLRVYRDEPEAPPVPVVAPPAADLDEQMEAKVDAVLEKVARSGQDSLTESERQILLRASELYRKRRT